ncbi:MAG: ABC transporter substrate-binding protein, partial [Nocardioidaceae bacterium]
YADFGLKDQMPLIGPGFLTDDGILAEQGQAALGMRTALHYSPLLDGQRNQEFASAYQKQFKVAATTYVMQSYDAAQLIDLALTDNEVEPGDAEGFVTALEKVGTIPSPRGDFSLTTDTHDPVQPVYLREVQQVNGTLANAVIEDLGDFEPLPSA